MNVDLASRCTVRVVVPLTPFSVPLMIVAPTPALVAMPLLLMMATPASDEAQVTKLERLWVVPSLKLPVAVKVLLVPSEIEGLFGITEIDVRDALVTVRVYVPTIPPM